MNDKSIEGFGWALATTILSLIAAESPNLYVKFFTAIGAVATGAQTVRCFQTVARQSYDQLMNSKSVALTTQS